MAARPIDGLFTPLRWSSNNQLRTCSRRPSSMSHAIRSHRAVAGPRSRPLLAAVLSAAHGGRLVDGGGMGMDIHSDGLHDGRHHSLLVVGRRRHLAGSRRPDSAVPTLVLVMLLGPFVFFDTLFPSPAARRPYVIFSFGLLSHGRRRAFRTRALLAVSASAALAYLLHASNAFTLFRSRHSSWNHLAPGLRADAVTSSSPPDYCSRRLCGRPPSSRAATHCCVIR